MNKEPSEFDIGQLYEDYHFLEGILLNNDEPIGYSLVWLSSILKYIGENYSK